MNPKVKKQLPLTHALGWIVGSLLITASIAYPLKRYLLKAPTLKPPDQLRHIVQTGPRKEILKTEYLAEWLGLSRDKPTPAQGWKSRQAEKRLLQSPLIAKAAVKKISPDTIYIDYTAREPIAWLEDYENIALDNQGFAFPFTPFFTPKNLPALYFGLSAFGTEGVGDKPSVHFGRPLQGKHVDLAFHILEILTQVPTPFSIKRIDVSNAFTDSYGTEEIVVIIEETFRCADVSVQAPYLLRLSRKSYCQQLGNYLNLRKQLIDNEKESFQSTTTDRVVTLHPRILDFRIDKLAFIQK